MRWQNTPKLSSYCLKGLVNDSLRDVQSRDCFHAVQDVTGVAVLKQTGSESAEPEVHDLKRELMIMRESGEIGADERRNGKTGGK